MILRDNFIFFPKLYVWLMKCTVQYFCIGLMYVDERVEGLRMMIGSGLKRVGGAEKGDGKG